MSSPPWDRILWTTTGRVSIGGRINWLGTQRRLNRFSRRPYSPHGPTALGVSLDDSRQGLVIAPRPHHSVAVRVEVQALNVAQRYLVIDRSSHEVADVSGKFGPLSVDDVPEPHQLEDVADTADGIGEVLGNTGKFEFADGGEELAAAVAWLWNWENSRSRASKSGYQRGFRSS